jgi:hypothetical protein
LITPDQWKEKEAEFRFQWERVKPSEFVVVDKLIIGDEKNELEHKFQGEKTSTRSFVGRKWRQFDKDGWCTMEVKVLPNEDHELRISSWGSNVNRPLVEVLVDGTKLARLRVEKQPEIFYDAIYPISADMVKGKNTITVKLQAESAGSWPNGIFSLKIVKKSATDK